MSDQTINQFVAQFADAAARVAFVPDPPTPAADGDNGYFAFQQDDGSIWCWDSALVDWVQVGNGSGANTVSAAGTLTANQIVLGAGAKAVAALGSLGTTTTVLHGNAAGAPTFGAVALATDVSGDLPFANLTQGSALSVLGVTGNSTADVASIAAGSDHQVLRRSGTAVAFGQVNLAQSAAVTGVLPVANGGTGSASGAGILRATATVTNAQYLTLPTSAVSLITTPGAGFMINFLYARAYAKFASGAYTGASAASSYIYIAFGSTQPASSAIVNDTSTIPTLGYLATWNAATNKSTVFGPYLNTTEAAANWGVLNHLVASFTGENEALMLVCENGAVDFGGGNAANTLKIDIYYTIEAVP